MDVANVFVHAHGSGQFTKMEHKMLVDKAHV